MKKLLTFTMTLFLVSCNGDFISIMEANRATPSKIYITCPDAPLELREGYNKFTAVVKTFPANVDVEYKFSSDNKYIRLANTEKDNNFEVILNKTDAPELCKTSTSICRESYGQKAKIKVEHVDNTGRIISDVCEVIVEDEPPEYKVPATNLIIWDKTGNDITGGEYDIKYSNTENLTLIIVPTNSTDVAKWRRVEGNSKIQVTEDGQVSVPLDAGADSAKLEVKAGDITKTVVIKPKENTPVAKIIAQEEIKIAEGDEGELNLPAMVFPTNAFNNNLNWKLEQIKGTGLSLEGFEQGKQNHMVKFKYANTIKEGDSGKITISAADGSGTELVINIKVTERKIPVTKVTITRPTGGFPTLIHNPKEVGFGDIETLKIKYLQLGATIEPANPSVDTLVWESSDNDIAMVFDGEVQARSQGRVTITAYSLSNPDVKDSIELNVESAKKVTGFGNFDYKFVTYNTDGTPKLNPQGEIETKDVSGNNSITTPDAKGFLLYDDKNKGEIIIQANVAPSDATNKKIKFQTVTPDVVAIEELATGKVKVTPKGVGGRAVLLAFTQDGLHKQIINLRMGSIALQDINATRLGNGWYNSLANKTYGIMRTPLSFNLGSMVNEFVTQATNSTCQNDKAYKETHNCVPLYRFIANGDIGINSGTPETSNHNLPLSSITYDDARALANALTDFYNWKNDLKGADRLDCYYYIDNNKDKCYIDVANGGGGVRENTDAKGFRLATDKEWQFAAALGPDDDISSTELMQNLTGVDRIDLWDRTNSEVNGKAYKTLADGFPSGMTHKLVLETYKKVKDEEGFTKLTNGRDKKNYLIVKTAEKLAWFADNSDNRTHVVATKLPTALGIYDMSGNNVEFVSGGSQRGGRFNSGIGDISINSSSSGGASDPRSRLGVRYVRNK